MDHHSEHHSELKTRLQAAGWKMFPPDRMKESGVNWRASLRTEGMPECLCNHRSPQLIVTPWDLTAGSVPYRRVEVSICGETKVGWLELKAYELPVDLEAIIQAGEALKLAWIAAASY